jgi:Flp pilus assembly protein TadB
MYLSDHDRRVLAELESQFAAGSGSGGRSRAAATVRRRLGAVTGVVGVVLLIVGLLVGVAGGILAGAILLASWVVRPLRRRLWEAQEGRTPGPDHRPGADC